LEEVNRELEAFSYSVSHDLKAPLRAISGFSQALQEDYPQHHEEANRYIEIIRKNAENMATLINNLLSLSRLGRKALRIQPVNITSVAEQVVRQLTVLEKNKVSVTLDHDLPVVRADESMMIHVMQNLLSNAIKFSSTQKIPKIEVGSLTKGNQKVIYVKDNGVGFDMKYVDKVFSVFQRLHTQEEYPGTGVGLAIVQRIINKHGGTIWVESEKNVGTTFYFTV
jgi:light-regulated signal transduction histidine kinase (bacteriophytochrome)